jgi:hypothetical protein
MAGKHRANMEAQQQDEAYAQGQQSMMSAPAPPPAAAPSGGISSEDTARLQQLGELHAQGILTDEEFAQQKARILGG